MQDFTLDEKVFMAAIRPETRVQVSHPKLKPLQSDGKVEIGEFSTKNNLAIIDGKIVEQPPAFNLIDPDHHDLVAVTAARVNKFRATWIKTPDDLAKLEDQFTRGDWCRSDYAQFPGMLPLANRQNFPHESSFVFYALPKGKIDEYLSGNGDIDPEKFLDAVKSNHGGKDSEIRPLQVSDQTAATREDELHVRDVKIGPTPALWIGELHRRNIRISENMISLSPPKLIDSADHLLVAVVSQIGKQTIIPINNTGVLEAAEKRFLDARDPEQYDLHHNYKTTEPLNSCSRFALYAIPNTQLWQFQKKSQQETGLLS